MFIQDFCFIVLTGIVAVIDFYRRIIPNRILSLMIMIRIVFILFEENVLMNSITSIISGFAGCVVFLISYLLSKNSTGAGDVKLFFVIGFYFSVSQTISIVFFSLICSVFFSIVLLLFGKIKIKDYIPFAPFAFLGAAINFYMR